MSEKLLPNNDPDLKLARQIGASLEEGRELQFPESELLESLLKYKRQRKQVESISAEWDSNALWKTIEKETTSDRNTQKVQPIGISRTAFIWAAAATILIAAFAGIFYYQSQQPQLLAYSKQQIETITLADGSNVTLRPHTSLYALPGDEQSHNYRLSGEAYFEVVADAGRTFSVEAGNARVSVLGTKFDLSSWGEQTQVYLEEGSIRFENKTTNESVILSEGESAETSENDTISTTISEYSEFTDWMNKELIFRNKTAGYVFNELEQEFDLRISAPKSVMQTRLSGGLSLENPQQSLEDLSLVLGGRFIKEGDNSYRFVGDE